MKLVRLICVPSLIATSISLTIFMSSCNKSTNSSLSLSSPKNWFKYDEQDSTKIVGINDDLVK